MDINKLSNMDLKFGSSSNYVRLGYILNGIKDGSIRLMEGAEETPMEITIFKVITGFPIHVIMSTRRINGKMQQTVIKGNGDLKNITRWANEDIPVIIQGKEIFFKNIPEHLINYILNQFSISSTIMDESTGTLSDEELAEIVKMYY